MTELYLENLENIINELVSLGYLDSISTTSPEAFEALKVKYSLEETSHVETMEEQSTTYRQIVHLGCIVRTV